MSLKNRIIKFDSDHMNFTGNQLHTPLEIFKLAGYFQDKSFIIYSFLVAVNQP